MSESPQPNIDDAASQLLERLDAIRRANADEPEAARRAALERALEEQLAGRPVDTAKRVVAVVRERLIADARARDARFAELETETIQLRGQLQAVTAERERLQAELRELKAAKPAQPVVTVAATSDALERIREGLLKVGKGEEPTAESLGLGASEARLFRLIRELLTFTLRSEYSVNLLIDQFNVGPGVGMDSMQIKMQKKQVSDRFLACLSNEEGSVAALQKALEKMKSFLLELNSAYDASVYEGTRTILQQFDPGPIAEKHRKPIIGVDHGEAWKTLGRIHGDLVSMSRKELWERFFFGPFRSKLSAHLDGAGQ